jgi:hypothetical protein
MAVTTTINKYIAKISEVFAVEFDKSLKYSEVEIGILYKNGNSKFILQEV